MNYKDLNKEDLIKEIRKLNKEVISLKDFDGLFAGLLDSFPDAVVLTDLNGNLLNANTGFKNLFNIKKNLDLFGLKSFNTVDGINLKAVFGKVLSEKEPQNIKLRLKNSEYNFRMSVYEAGKERYFVIMNTSVPYISDESPLIIEDPAFRKLINYIDIGIAIIDPEMRIVLSNDKMKEYYPSLDDTKKYTCYKFYNNPPRAEPCDYCPTIKSFKDGKRHKSITDTPFNNSIANFRVMSSPVQDKNGNIKYVIEIVEDISEKKQTELKLKEQLRFTEYLIDSIPEPVFYKDVEGKYIMCNTAFAEYFGYKKEDIIGKNSYDIYEKKDAESFIKMDIKLLKKGGLQRYEYNAWHQGKNENRDLFLTKAPFYDFNRNIAGIIGIITDITERKAYERTLIEHQEYINNLIDTANIMILSLDLKGNIVLFNKKAEEITGYKSKEVIGKNYFELIAPKNKYPHVYDAFISLTDNSRVSTEYMENYILTKKGQERLISWRNSEVKTNGELKGILSFGIDITERIESDAIIKKLSFAVEQTSDLIFITDPGGNIEYVNPAFTSITGYSREEVIGKNPNLLKSYQMDENVYKELLQTLSSGKAWYGEFINRKKNGELTYLYGSVSPVKDNMNNVTNFISIYSDISSIKSAYEELRAMKGKVQSTEKMKYSFLSNMTNELRTPLINILGFTDVLNNETTDSWQLEILGDIKKQGKRLLRTLSLILKLAQIESNEIIPDFQRINLNQFTEEIYGEFKISADEKGLEFIITNPDEIIDVQSDPIMLKDIIQNLLDNAVKFTDKGFIKTGFRKINEDGKQYALLTVKDTGAGITKDRAKMIFTEFTKGNNNSGKNDGSGLGLAVSQHLAKLLECKLSFKSIHGKGSEFMIQIPLPEDKNLVKYDLRNGDKFRVKITGKDKPRVLLVEDNLSNINIVEIFLNEICTVDSVISGEDALKIIKKNNYDVIIMDINLGQGMNGIIAAREIMKTKKFGNVPIIAVTGYALYSDREKLLSEGFIDYLAKPFTKNQLVNLILKYVKK